MKFRHLLPAILIISSFLLLSFDTFATSCNASNKNGWMLCAKTKACIDQAYGKVNKYGGNTTYFCGYIKPNQCSSGSTNTPPYLIELC